jgi:phenylpropionate dioxygenase-like ring-hydroxylating dioxygenase large terminal subunit/putative sterol carrier protein
MLHRYPSVPHPLPRNPNGWFAVGLSHELAPGEVKAVSCLGVDLVVFRSQQGEVGILDAYCPHQGAHLGLGGCVEGATLRCPFHRWAFGTDGRCVDIPYSPRTPSQLATKHYPAIERNGAILAWFHADGTPPTWQMPELEGEGWSPSRWFGMDYILHIQEFAENGIDIAHFSFIHGSSRASTELVKTDSVPFHFFLRTAYPGDGIGMPGQYVKVTTEWRYYGLGIFLGISTADDFGAQIRQLFHFTPLPDDHIALRIRFNANRSTIPVEMISEVEKRNEEMTLQNFSEDRLIWQYKRYVTRPPLVEGDGPFGTLRRWTQQFYPPVRAEQPVLAETPVFQAEEPVPDPVVPVQSTEPPAPKLPTNARAGAMTVRETFFDRLPASFNAAAAGDLEFVVQYDLQGDLGAKYFVEVRNQTCAPSIGEHPSPNVRVIIDADDWLKLNSGALNRTKAFLTGRLKVKGDMALAMKLGEIFPG